MEMLVLTPKSIICRVLNYFLAFPWSSHTLLRVFFTIFLHFPLAFPSDGPIFFLLVPQIMASAFSCLDCELFALGTLRRLASRNLVATASKFSSPHFPLVFPQFSRTASLHRFFSHAAARFSWLVYLL